MHLQPRLLRSFYSQTALEVSRDLLGKRLVRLEGERRLSGIITETEAYSGQEDLGSHAHVGRTPRTQIMFGPPGHAYIYFTYGMHWCLNFVVAEVDFPAAILIRAILPTEGIALIASRRNGVAQAHWTDGPGKLTKALNIDGTINGADICAPESVLFVETAPAIPDADVLTGPRVGLYKVPEPWKSIPWRFHLTPTATESLRQG